MSDRVDQEQIRQWLLTDPLRLKCLSALSSMPHQPLYIAAGFVRNCVWDHLFGMGLTTPLNDVDVIFYASEQSQQEQQLQTLLQKAVPECHWQVKNQATMHLRNGHSAYSGCEHAMSYWPELETAVAVRLLDNFQLEFIAPFGLSPLLAGTITQNPKQDVKVFDQRIKSKSWLSIWPQLRVVRSGRGSGIS